MKYINHITLTTGHLRRSYRREVDSGVVALLQPLIAIALTGEHARIPGDAQPPCTITGGVAGRCISLTIWGPPYAGDLIPLAECGIAPHSRCGAMLWRSMHDSAANIGLPLQTSRDNCPQEPWCAAMLYQGLMLYQDAAGWLGDMERCLAWAWLERKAVP